MKSYYVDSHAHLQTSELRGEIDRVLKEASQAEVKKIICVGTNIADSKQALRLAERHRVVKASVGLHPHEAKNAKKDIDELEQLTAHKEVAAVGECGLDYYYLHSSKQMQHDVFRAQIELAARSNLPVILHIRSSRRNPDDAFDDLLRIWPKNSSVDAVVHSFSSSLTNLRRCLEAGFYIGLNGIMTFSGSTESQDICRSVPLDRLLLETDAPLLTPKPFRGKINQPKYVTAIAEFVAATAGLETKEIMQHSTVNAERLFSWLEDIS